MKKIYFITEFFTEGRSKRLFGYKQYKRAVDTAERCITNLLVEKVEITSFDSDNKEVLNAVFRR